MPDPSPGARPDPRAGSPLDPSPGAARATDETWPTVARVAAVLLIVLGLANGLAGVVALVAAPGELQTTAAVGLAGAGLVTVVLGVLVWRRRAGALYVALGVFELLLVARLVTIAGAGGTEMVALGLLVCVVALLWIATSQVRRRRRT